MITVLPINKYEATPWILKKHYARRLPPISYAFGAYDENKLIVVVTYGVSSSSTMRRGVCGEEWTDKVLEVNRLCCDNSKNIASMLVGRSMQLLPKPSIIVSYADTGQGHVGFVYQATNFIYTGLSTKFSDPKVKGLEHQHHSTYAHGMDMEQLREKFGDRLYYADRSRKHRYVYFCGSKTAKKNMLKALNYKQEPYPKGESLRYDAGANVKTQLLLFKQ